MQACSPELALIDPELRRQATSALAHVEPYAFLPRAGVFAAVSRADVRARHLPVPVAAAFYLIDGLMRMLVTGAVFMIAIGAVIAILTLVAGT